MSTFVERPEQDNSVSKVLMEMHSINQDYIQRLNEIENLHKVIFQLIHSDQKITGLDSLIHTNMHAINKWRDDLEQWQQMINQAELDSTLGSLARGICDDYEFYETDAQHLENIAEIAFNEAEKLKPLLEQTYSYEMVKQLIATIKRHSSQFKADLCAEVDSLSELYPSVFKGV